MVWTHRCLQVTHAQAAAFIEACERVSGLVRDGTCNGVECLGVIKGASDDGSAASRGGKQDDKTPECLYNALGAAVEVVELFFSKHERPEGYLGETGGGIECGTYAAT
jgi:hypothetical protein